MDEYVCSAYPRRRVAEVSSCPNSLTSCVSVVASREQVRLGGLSLAQSRIVCAAGLSVGPRADARAPVLGEEAFEFADLLGKAVRGVA